ncbi:Co2+/Mg2+ efflux protein ApaG [Permianibacter aggregans]|uniref:Protein ApaG n=1 Tax=Permianibacter aggregans TaxID=1510150 RepID=A0A4R6UQR6_9GAMM|nr:Co2+/Mg2+ efflux protein ApaG [Permianibacter aggregans]QGX40478.1 Co2+/Mg2+ efflux protein ApaG [Permianibacter aggregans]TDQ49381.1 ApaG protein [Permianibacter aggregans]
MENVPYQFDIRIQTQYVEDQSNPDDNRFVFAYTIRIENRGERAAQLVSRHWIITDSNGETVEVRGQGVVGEQPLLRPGESFEYTSGTVLNTPLGSMEGSYQMLGEDGNEFDATIPPFSLVEPSRLH